MNTSDHSAITDNKISACPMGDRIRVTTSQNCFAYQSSFEYSHVGVLNDHVNFISKTCQFLRQRV